MRACIGSGTPQRPPPNLYCTGSRGISPLGGDRSDLINKYLSLLANDSQIMISIFVNLAYRNLRDIMGEQGTRRDVRKIHVTRQFFEASGSQDYFFQKKTFLDMF